MPHQATARSSHAGRKGGKGGVGLESQPEVRPEFMAAIRFQNGRRELYRIRNAQDAQDARQVVLDQLNAVASVLVMPCSAVSRSAAAVPR
ncbi:hypothetical protein [Azovibrio sp.]|uniref:hypothetical protein n=1 Tax=Azovibrio sp. TaxID=1872673 RepID=UPI003C754365